MALLLPEDSRRRVKLFQITISEAGWLGVGTTAVVKEACVWMFRDGKVDTPPDHLFDSPHALGSKSGAATVAMETLWTTGVCGFILYVGF